MATRNQLFSVLSALALITNAAHSRECDVSENKEGGLRLGQLCLETKNYRIEQLGYFYLSSLFTTFVCKYNVKVRLVLFLCLKKVGVSLYDH